jgi:hypothetical protein
MELPVEKREALNEVVASGEWQDRVKALLESYLREFGIISESVRVRWISRVVDYLATRTELVAMDDILEEAVEHMQDLIEARVAMLSHLDPVREQKQIAQMLVVLLNEKNADCLNRLFERSDSDADPETQERLRQAMASSMLIPVPQDAPMEMPVQNIELRSINPLRRLFGPAR